MVVIINIEEEFHSFTFLIRKVLTELWYLKENKNSILFQNIKSPLKIT